MERLSTTKWVDLFQAVFSANTPEWQKTLGVWSVLFHAEGRSNSELVEAVYAVTRRNPVPRFAPEMLSAIREELRGQDEAVRLAHESQRISDLAKPIRCWTCRDTGWVTDLPHPEFVSGPQWLKPYRTVAVTCGCGLGKHIGGKWASAQPEAKPVLGWDEYQQRNPHWEVQVGVRQAERDAERAAWEQQHGNPFKEVVERIVARYRAQAEAEAARQF